MAFLNTQTIFNLFITLIVGAALYYYIKYKFRVLELTQREQAKMLQSVIISMNNTQGYGGPSQYGNDMRAGGAGGHMLSGDLSGINHDIERFKQVNNEELIDVSDDEEDEEDSDSESGSGSGDSDYESGSSDNESDGDDDEESHNTKKIIIGGNIESQTIEHLTGPDVKVIELSHPLYPSQNGNDEEDEDEDDDDDDDDDEDDEDDDSSENGNGDGNGDGNSNNTANIEEVTSTLNGVEYLEILDNAEHKLKTDAVDETDEISIKTVFKNKESDTHAHNDFNGMNVQSLRQLYKQRLLTEGKNMSEAAIGKLTKKELIKNLQQ
jgi:hypothetical protein